MKKVFFAFFISITFLLNQDVFGQGIWTQVASIPFTPRWGAVGFTIGSKGYVGTGYDGNTNYGDFWEYNPSTNVWTQVASVPARRAASAFTIGTKGYVCLGANSTSGPTLTDIWEYNQSTNLWVQKANFPSSARYGAAGFSIGSKGYIGCGNEGTSSGPFTNELWAFDPSTNSWAQKTSLPGPVRYGITHMGWELGGKGYICMGLGNNNTFLNDIYEYDPANDSWVQKANFPGTGRSYAVAFSNCYRFFAGTGQNSGTAMPDIWEYNPITDTWTQKANFGGGNRWLMTSFVLNGRGYIGTGYDFTNNYADWWQYRCDTEGILENEDAVNMTSVYPSVFSNYTTLEIKSNFTVRQADMKIFDVAGKLLRTDKISTNISKIERTDLNQGIYLYEVFQEGKKIGFGKFVIN